MPQFLHKTTSSAKAWMGRFWHLHSQLYVLLPNAIKKLSTLMGWQGFGPLYLLCFPSILFTYTCNHIHVHTHFSFNLPIYLQYVSWWSASEQNRWSFPDVRWVCAAHRKHYKVKRAHVDCFERWWLLFLRKQIQKWLPLAGKYTVLLQATQRVKACNG